MTKSKFDSVAHKNPIAIYPNFKKFAEIKISSLLKRFYISSDG